MNASGKPRPEPRTEPRDEPELDDDPDNGPIDDDASWAAYCAWARRVGQPVR